MSRDDSVISLLNNYVDLNFDVIKKAVNSRYGTDNDIQLVILGLIALFSKFILTTSSAKQLQDTSHVHVVCLMYKLLSIAKDSDDLST